MSKSNSTNPVTWAKLVSINPVLPNVGLTDNSYTLREPTSNETHNIRPNDTYCRIYKDDTNDCYWIEDLSPNGISVEEKIIGKGNKHKLEFGEKIYFNLKTGDKIIQIPTYVFCPTMKEPNKLKRYREKNKKLKEKMAKKKKQGDELKSSICLYKEENKNLKEDMAKQMKQGDELKSSICLYKEENKNLKEGMAKQMKQGDELKCTICLDYIYSCVTVMPCLHNFCGSCISDWILQSKVCPNCKQKYTDLKKNPTLNTLIENFVEINPHLKKSQKEQEEKDEKDIIKWISKVNTFEDGARYEGTWINGRKEGKGRYIYSDGAFYEGDWVNDKKEGKGKEKYPDGDFYEGDWVNGKREGKGKYTFSNGDFYEGDWVNDKKEGKGKETYSSGTFYEGDWVNDRKEGKGRYTHSDGTFYEGDWVNDKRRSGKRSRGRIRQIDIN